MADSKFLRYQDANGDFLNDACDELIAVEEVSNCPDCVRDPNAVVPNWLNQGIEEPWFNGKFCTYQVTVPTAYQTIYPYSGSTDAEAEANIDNIFNEYKHRATEALLLKFNKVSSSAAVDTVVAGLEHSAYDMAPRESSYLKLLYSVPYSIFEPIEESDPETDEDEEETSPSTEGVTVTYTGPDLRSKINQVRRGLKLYGRYYRVYQAMEGGTLVESDSGAVFSPKKLDRYASSESVILQAYNELDRFLNEKKINLFSGVKDIFNFSKNVEEITLTWAPDYKGLTQLQVKVALCGDAPITFGKSKLKLLNMTSPFKDRTAMGYLSKIDDMLEDLTAREPIQWLEFLTKYTHPGIVETFDTQAMSAEEQEASSCVGQALSEESKQLGQDILDSAFSIGDAIAYAFNRDHCKANLDEVIDEQIKLGLIYDPNTDSERTIMDLAKEQAFGKMKRDNQVFANICAKALTAGVVSGQGAKMLEQIWGEGFDRIKFCGLKNLALEAIGCLFKGMSLEKALAKMLTSAMENMSLDHFGELLVGLPPEQQEKIEAAAKERLEAGDAFRSGTGGQLLSDGAATAVEYKGYKPWNDPEEIEREKGYYAKGGPGIAEQETPPSNQNEIRTLIRVLDPNSNKKSDFDNKSIIGAYIGAMIDVYSDDLLSLVDKMNSFPGGVIISRLILASDCPRPPIFEPNFVDFINSIDLPICRRIDPVILPRLVNPGGWIPKIKDWSKLVLKKILEGINAALLQIALTLLGKICELFGNAMCKILETTGDILQSLPDAATGRSTFSDIVKDAICGEDADEDKVNDTIADMFNKLGVGGSALSNSEEVANFAGDLSASATRREMMGAFLGECDPDFLEIADMLIENQYPLFREAFGTKEDICDFFTNCGDLFPADVKAQMDDFLNQIPEDDMLPANPTLCATPEKLQDWCDARVSLLEGKASPSQARQMCEMLQDQMANDLGDLANLMQGPAKLPPIVSTPGCDDGMIPFQPEEIVESSSENLGREMKALQLAFARDMLGNGGFAGWGMLNMILSDTNGRPFTNHARLADNRLGYVDFVVDNDLSSGDILSMFLNPGPVDNQYGQYPAYVAEWLLGILSTFRTEFVSNNNYETDKLFVKTFDELGFDAPFSKAPNVNLLGLPDYGYNVVPLPPNFMNQKLQFLKRTRKRTPDVQLQFKDNNNSIHETRSKRQAWSYGFNVNLFLSDIHSDVDFVTSATNINAMDHSHRYTIDNDGNGSTTDWCDPDAPELCHRHEIIDGVVQEAQNDCYPYCADEYGYGIRGFPAHTHNLNEETVPKNIYSDNCRVSIIDLYNLSAKQDNAATAMMSEEEQERLEDERGGKEESSLSNRRYEFFSADNTLSKVELGQYTDWKESFDTHTAHIPQVALLQNMIEVDSGTFIDKSVLKTYHDYVMSDLFDSIAYEISYNSAAFSYGAQYDDLSSYTAEYVVDDGQVEGVAGGTLYSDVRKPDGEPLVNDDSILGISRDQFINKDDPDNIRFFYLDPSQYGGNYVNPPYYVVPLKNEGWMGLVQALFPDSGFCKPYNTDLVDFAEIEKSVSKAYSELPEDERLAGNPECVFEPPYHKILERQDRAAIEGIIAAVTRSYAATHLIKSLATFGTFAPKFPDVFSSIFAQYIVENMEFSFRDPVGASWDGFTLFSDEEYWYAFLEQSVQMFGRKVDTGEIIDPDPVAVQACIRLNDLQERYTKPSKKDHQDAQDTYQIPWYQRYKSYTGEKRLDAIKLTEGDAKLVLKELIMIELNKIGEQFSKALETMGMQPTYTDISYYVMTKLSQGGQDLDVDKGIKEETLSLPIEGSNHYTPGDEMSDSSGEPYVGFYHVHVDDNGNTVYMEGKYHSDEPHDALNVYADKTIIPIGDVVNLYGGSSFDYESTSQPFILEKYISINGQKKNPTDALDEILENDSSLNLSDVYPGNLSLVYANSGSLSGSAVTGSGPVVGLSGSLGVRYGLQFSLAIGGGKYPITNVEVDALDLKISQTAPFEGNSKRLLCLVNKLKEDNRFKIVTNYIFPINKVLGTWAIYNDMALLPSIGQVRVGKKEYKDNDDLTTKPGISISFDDNGQAIYSYVAGWRSALDKERWTPFVKTWNEWDQVLLKNTKTRAKRFFRMHYNSLNLRPGDFSGMFKFGGFNPWKLMMNNLRDNIRPLPGQDIMPWWKRRLERPNPYNANNKLCTKDDEQ